MQRNASLAILVLAMFAVPSFGQHAILFPFDSPDGLCGYIDASGQVVIPARFKEGREFHEGRAWVLKGDKVGFIDESGKLVIDTQYDAAGDFSEGLACVGTGPDYLHLKRGYVDRDGREVIALQYDIGGRFKEGLAVVAAGAVVRYIDATGRVAIDRGERLLPYEAIRPLLDSPREFSEGLAAFSAASGVEKWGYFDKSGKTVIPPQFDRASSFSEGLARVKLDGREVYIDHTGAMVLRPDADRDESRDWTVHSFSEGLAGIRIGGKWGFIDRKGNVVIKPQFDGVGAFVHERAWVVAGKSVGYIDPAGQAIVPPRFVSLNGPMFGGESAGEDFSNGLARVRSAHGCWGYIDAAGRYVWQFAGLTGEWPCLEPATPQSPEAIVARARELVTKGEAAEAAGGLSDLSSDAFEASANALAGHLKSHADEVGTIVLAARLERLREVLLPIVAEGAHFDEDLKAAATGIHERVDPMESLLDHALTIEPRNAEIHYWKARLFGIRTPPLLRSVVKQDVSDFDRAIGSMQKAVELAPDVVLYKETLAAYFIEADRFGEAAAALALVAGGRHPMYVLLRDLQQVPLPEGAIFDRDSTEMQAAKKLEAGEMRDYTKLRIRSWLVPGPAARVEQFYRAKWPGFALFKVIDQSQRGGVAITGYVEGLRWDGVRPVPLGALRTLLSESMEGKLSVSVIEFHADAGRAEKVIPTATLLPEDARKLFCMLTIYNHRTLSP